MKILVITSTIKPDSGWGRYSKEIIKILRTEGLEVIVVSDDDLAENYFWRRFSLIRRLARDCDLVHAFDGWPYAVYGFFAVIGRKKKFFINAIGTYSVAPLADWLKGFLLKLAYRRAKRIFAISNFVKNRILEKISLKNIETIYLGRPSLPEPRLAEVEICRAKYQLNGRQPILLTVGAIKDRKGQFDTVRAVEILKKSHPGIFYLIVGSDKDQAYVGKIKDYLIGHDLVNNVRIVGFVTDQELASLYSASDIFLLNSKDDGRHFEGFGLALLEAAQFGKPVVASSDSGTAEALADGFNGYLSLAGDPASIAAVVGKTLSQYDFLAGNSKSFAQNFSWEKTVSEYLKHYR